MGIRRAIWQLKEAGWFKKASGFLIGRPLAAWNQNMMGVDQYNAVTDILKPLGLPIFMDVDIGHISPAMPLVMGAHTFVKIQDGNINLTFDLN